MLKVSKTIKIMKGSKNGEGLTQEKTILHISKQELSIYCDIKEIHTKK